MLYMGKKEDLPYGNRPCPGRRALSLVLVLLMAFSIWFPVSLSQGEEVHGVGSSFSIAGQTYPTTLKQGSPFTLKGRVSSAAPIKAITVGVMDKSGKWINGYYYYNGNVNAKTFDVSKADSRVPFNRLKPGAYSYRIAVRDANGTSKYVLIRSFNVISKTTPKSNITGSGLNYPVGIKQGGGFSIKGTINSAVNISALTIGVMDAKGKWVDGVYYYNGKVNAKTFNVAKADSAVKFNNLMPGTYTYRIAVRDANGTSKYVLIRKFAVSKTASGFKITGNNYPSTVSRGSSFSVKGKVSSNVNIAALTIGVMNSSGKWVTFYYNGKVNARTFDVSKANGTIKFQSLAPGTYSYRIAVRDVNGTSKYVLNKKFNVQNAFTISGATYPGTITQYNDFSVKGTISSGYNIAALTIGVQDTKGKWVPGGIYYNGNVKAKTFNVSTANSWHIFSRLAPGTYYYSIAARDVNGLSKYVVKRKFTVKAVDFEAYMKKQGFPESYKPYLRKLHQAHPSWKFIAQKAGYYRADGTIGTYTWDLVLDREYKGGANYVNSTFPWYTKVNSNTVDGGAWNLATKKTIAYYLDPRNFLNEASIYQFMDQRPKFGVNDRDHIKTMVSSVSCFLNTTEYIDILFNTGNESGVNPCVTAAMVLMEQGYSGTSDLISGTYSGKISSVKATLKGHYNFFNIGAYEGSVHGVVVSPVARGLWWAAGQLDKEGRVTSTSYGRPWNTKEKAMTGGVRYYAENYVESDQYTYYTKKFNVVIRPGEVLASHQYMANVAGADQEGKTVKKAYAKDDRGLVFRIPVYDKMPSKACPFPTKTNY